MAEVIKFPRKYMLRAYKEVNDLSRGPRQNTTEPPLLQALIPPPYSESGEVLEPLPGKGGLPALFDVVDDILRRHPRRRDPKSSV